MAHTMQAAAPPTASSGAMNALLKGGTRSAASSSRPVATPTRSLFGIIEASRRAHVDAYRCPATSSAAPAQTSSIVVHTDPPPPVRSLSALFAGLDKLRTRVQGSLSKSVPAPPLCSLKRSVVTAATAPHRARSPCTKRARGDECDQTHRGRTSRSTGVPEAVQLGIDQTKKGQLVRKHSAEAAAPMITPGSAVMRGAATKGQLARKHSEEAAAAVMLQDSSVTRHAARESELVRKHSEEAVPDSAVTRPAPKKGARVARGPKQQAKQLREELEAQSFGPGRDFLLEGASQSKVTSTALVVLAPASPNLLQRRPVRSPGSDSGVKVPVEMSPSSLAFLEGLHTGLTPPKDGPAEAALDSRNSKSKSVVRRLFTSSPAQGKGKRGRPKLQGQARKAARKELLPAGLEDFMLEAKARRAGMPLRLLDGAPPPRGAQTTWRGTAAVGELRQALRSIDDSKHQNPALGVAESEDEGSDADEFVPIAIVPVLDASLPADAGFI